MRTVYFVRHGEVEKQFQNCYNGWNDIGLSEHGVKQIENAAKQFGEIPLLISSDLKRCACSIELFSYNELEISSAIREKSWGKHEGMSFQEIEQSGIQYHSFEQFISDLDGESSSEFERRVLQFWNEKRDYLPHGTVILSHGGVIRQILAFEHNCSLEESYMKFNVPYGSVTSFEIK